MSCVERLQMPVYPPLARQASIAGTVTTIVALMADGSAQVDAEGHRLLTQAVEKAIKASIFRKECAGKSIKLLFSFVAGGELDPEKLPYRISFGYPNQFWITAPGMLAQP